jgi:antirestriction protein ArdC
MSAQINGNLRHELEELAAELVTSPEKIKEFAERWQSGFHRYSFHNLILIWTQCPDSKLCAGFNLWKKQGRHVKAGEKALWILAPMIGKRKEKKTDSETGETVEIETPCTWFKPVPVFDIAQTDGKPLDIGSNRARGGEALDLEALAKAFPEFEFAVSQGIEDGWTDGRQVRVSERQNRAQMIAAFLHEIAHNVLGHTGEQRKNLTRELVEIEAESAAYLVESCLGIENEDAKTYIASWRGSGDKLKASALKIISAAEVMLKKIRGTFSPEPSPAAC